MQLLLQIAVLLVTHVFTRTFGRSAPIFENAAYFKHQNDLAPE